MKNKPVNLYPPAPKIDPTLTPHSESLTISLTQVLEKIKAESSNKENNNGDSNEK